MTSYRRKINGIDIASCKEITDFYLRVSEIAKGFGIESSTNDFYFRCGEKTYCKESFEEFTKAAYGKTDFELLSMQLMYYLPNEESITVHYLLGSFSAWASNEALLDIFIDRLDAEFDTDNNAIEDTDSKRSGKQRQKKQKPSKPKKWSARVKDFFVGVAQDVVSNIVWWLLGLAVAAIAALIATL